ncbi:MAG: hypothetical protein CVV52_04865 [Spirochaetae bacterium HGW-Spirochaetae-8]|jgi:hypothetical protein|nr:MAG: hypothetical protein CVV52_04865 [Spirochaetae bacterium HGW-Spirochaetae-8]
MAAAVRLWLGRLFCLVLFLLYAPTPLEALSNPNNLSFIVKNDSTTLGLSENPDDLRSYGTSISFSYYNGWFGDAQITGLTNRSVGPSAEGRYDELDVSAGYAFRVMECSPNNAFSFSIEPSLGLMVSGYLGLESVQNLWHNVITVPTVELQYDAGGTLIFAPRFSLTGSLLYSERAPWFDSTDILFRLRSTVMFASGYEWFANGTMEIGQQTTEMKYLFIGAGYAYRENLDGRPTHLVVSDSEQGVMASFDARFGLLMMTYQWYLNSSHGFGGLGVDIGGNSTERWTASDLVMTLSLRMPYEKLMTNVRYKVGPALSVFASNSYTMKLLSPEQQVRENLSTWLVGFDYEFDNLHSRLLVPFVALGAGFRRFLLAGPNDNPDDVRAVLYDQLRFSSEFSAGVRFLQRGEVQWGGISYGVELAAGVAYLDTRGLVEVVEGVELVKMRSWQLMVRVGVTMGGSL